jgi:hypothetical protein
VVVDVRRYAVTFIIDVHNAAIGHTSWRQYMPFNQLSNDYFEKMR